MNWRPFASVILTTIIATGTPSDARSETAPLWDGLVAGRYEVGFKRIWTFDHSRVWPRSSALDSPTGSVARPIRVDVWFPATCSHPDRMQLRDYLYMNAPSAEFDDLVQVTRDWDEYSYQGVANRDSVAFDRLMSTETAVCSEANSAPGRFPLVVYSAGWFNRAPDNTILAEYLATHGIVVATVPQLNPGLWTYDFQSDAVSVEHQVRDLEVALGAVIEEPFVDRRRVAAMGYSTGGDVALLLQGRNPLVDAVVALDASWTLGSENDVVSSPFFTPQRHSVPIFAARRPSEEGIGYNDVLERLTLATRVVVDIPGADHGSFSDDPAQLRLLGTATAEHQAKHVLVVEAVNTFLQAVLVSHDSVDWSAMTSPYQSNGMQSTVMPATEEDPGGSQR